jgi:hypothetical protein
MNAVLERTVEKINEKRDEEVKLVSAEEAKELERMAQFRLSDAIREGASVTDQAYTWERGGALCALSAAAASAKARGYLK